MKTAKKCTKKCDARANFFFFAYWSYNCFLFVVLVAVSLLNLRPCLHGVGDPGLVGLVSFVFTLWGHKTKETYPTRPGSPTPCKQGLKIPDREIKLRRRSWKRRKKGTCVLSNFITPILNCSVVIKRWFTTKVRKGQRIGTICNKTAFLCTKLV